MKKWSRLNCRRLWTQTSPPSSSSRSSRFSPGNVNVSRFTVMPSTRPSLLVTTDSVTTRPLLHTICHIRCVWTQKSRLVGQPSTHLLLTRWWLQWLKNSPPRMNTRNFSGRSWPLFRRLKFQRFLQALQLRQTCSCCVGALFWRTSTSSLKFLLLCGRHRLRETMWWVPNQRSFRIVSVPSGKPTWWLARLWRSSRSSENPSPARLTSAHERGENRSERQVDTVLCAGAAAHGVERGLDFVVWNFAWDRLASRLYAATATTFLMKVPLILEIWW